MPPRCAFNAPRCPTIHGGAGSFRGGAGRAAPLRERMQACLAHGARALAAGDAALDVVERAVRELEADPLFNAGAGSVLTAEGRVEMDASIMDGRTRNAGAVACVTGLAHPISAARLVMERTPHAVHNLCHRGLRELRETMGRASKYLTRH